MPSSHINDPDHWRGRAAEARAAAELMPDQASREAMLRVAADYEEIAKRAQERMTKLAPQPPSRSAG
jgi:hypothetical protein